MFPAFKPDRQRRVGENQALGQTELDLNRFRSLFISHMTGASASPSFVATTPVKWKQCHTYLQVLLGETVYHPD